MVFTELGFNLARIDLNLELLPNIVFAVDGLEKISISQLQESAKKYKEDVDILLVVNGLIKAKNLTQDMLIEPYVLTRVWFTVGLIPSIRLTFQEKSANLNWLTSLVNKITAFFHSFYKERTCLDY